MTSISPPLEQHPFGRKGQQVTVIGLGGGSLDKHSLDTGVATVHRALELGINYFDTAPFYGNRASQVIMGYALEGRPEPYMLATKLGFLREVEHHRRAEALWVQLGENLNALRRQQVDLLQVHQADLSYWWEDGEAREEPINVNQTYDFADAPVLQVLRRAKAEGLCRWIGMTTDHPDELAHVLRHVDLEVDACLVSGAYTLYSRRAHRNALPLARERGLAYIAARVLAPVGVGKNEIPDKRLADLQKRSRLSLVEMAVRDSIGHPSITTTLVGAASPSELEQCVAAAQRGPLPKEVQEAVNTLVDD